MQNEMHFTTEIKTRWVQTIWVGIWTTGVAFGLAVLTFNLISTTKFINDLILVWLFMLLIFLLAIDYLSWQLRGKEVLSIKENGIELKNVGTFFSHKATIDFEEFEGLEYDDDSKRAFWIKFWGIGGGRIKVNYLGRHRRFGQDLTLEEAKLLHERIKEQLIRRKTAD